MKVITVLGTRPEIIRLSRIIPLLDRHCEHLLVHTGQNFDPNLTDIFFRQLGVRTPDRVFPCSEATGMEQIGRILIEGEKLLKAERPDRLLVLGDTNSGLLAIVSKRLGIPVYHMEAGNRCFDDRVPEEVNRRIIDHASDILMPYTERSRDNLLCEGIPSRRIFVTGNPIKEVLDHYEPQIASSNAMQRLRLESKRYFLITLHRAENVDIPERLVQFQEAFRRLAEEHQMPLLWPIHPRSSSHLQEKPLAPNGLLRLIPPLGLFDFVHLQKNALCVLTDSGTVQEETCLFGIPSVTLRDVTERPETLEAGSNLLSGCVPESISGSVRIALHLTTGWRIPTEYNVSNVSGTVTRIVLGYQYR